jgi:hypothetical protein
MSTPLNPLKTKLDQERRAVLHRIPAAGVVKIAIEAKSDQARFAAKRTQQAVTELLKLLSPTESTKILAVSGLSDKQLESVLKQPLAGGGTVVVLDKQFQTDLVALVEAIHQTLADKNISYPGLADFAPWDRSAVTKLVEKTLPILRRFGDADDQDVAPYVVGVFGSLSTRATTTFGLAAKSLERLYRDDALVMDTRKASKPWAIGALSDSKRLLLPVGHETDTNENVAGLVHECTHAIDGDNRTGDPIYRQADTDLKADADFYEADENDKIVNASHYEYAVRLFLQHAVMGTQGYWFTPKMVNSGSGARMRVDDDTRRIRAKADAMIKGAWVICMDIHDTLLFWAREKEKTFGAVYSKEYDRGAYLQNASKLLGLTIHKSTDWRLQVSQIDLSIAENRITSLGQMMQKSKFVDGLAIPDILTPDVEMTCARSIVLRIVTDFQKIRKEAQKTEAMICILSEMYGIDGKNRTARKILGDPNIKVDQLFHDHGYR